MVTWTREGVEALKEDDFSREVLVPLFHAMGYRDVRFYGGGVLEQGKDLIMWREEPIRGRVNTASVVKMTPITGKTTTGVVVTQLREAFGKTYLDPATAQPIRVNDSLVVTPFEITKEGTFTLEGLVSNEPFAAQVTYVDGTRLWELIDKYLGSKLLLSRLLGAYQDIQRVAPVTGLTIDGNRLSISFIHRSDEHGEGVQPRFVNTATGKSSEIAYEKFVTTGTPVELPLSDLEGASIPAFFEVLGISPEDTNVRFDSTLAGVRAAILLRGHGGMTVTVDDLLFDVTGGSEQLRLTNEAQNCPLHFEITATFRPQEPLIATLQLTSSVPGWSAQWLRLHLSIQEILASGCDLFLRNNDTRIEHRLGVVPPRLVDMPDRRLLELVRTLAWIEQELQEPLRIPERALFTQEDLVDLEIVRSILTTGKRKVESASFTLQPSERRDLVIAAFSSSAARLRAESPWSKWQLLDNHVNLGPATLECHATELRPKLPLDEAVAAVTRGKPVDLEIRPAAGKQIIARYKRWSTR